MLSYEKSYYITTGIGLKGNFASAFSICKDYGMEFVSLEDQKEHDYFLQLCFKNKNLFSNYFTLLGGITRSAKRKDNYYWMNSGKKADYNLKFGGDLPDNSLHGNGRPVHWADGEYCLGLEFQFGTSASFNDLPCWWVSDFVCEMTCIQSI
jgi:hypothetical protein